MPERIRYEKACDCKPGLLGDPVAKLGMVRLGPARVTESGMIELKIWYIPGPSCDVCGRPWKRLEEES